MNDNSQRARGVVGAGSLELDCAENVGVEEARLWRRLTNIMNLLRGHLDTNSHAHVSGNYWS